IAFIIFLVVPDLQETLGSFISQVPAEINLLYNKINQYIADNPQILETVNQLDVDTNQLRDQLFSIVQSFTSGILDTNFILVGKIGRASCREREYLSQNHRSLLRQCIKQVAFLIKT